MIISVVKRLVFSGQETSLRSENIVFVALNANELLECFISHSYCKSVTANGGESSSHLQQQLPVGQNTVLIGEGFPEGIKRAHALPATTRCVKIYPVILMSNCHPTTVVKMSLFTSC